MILRFKSNGEAPIDCSLVYLCAMPTCPDRIWSVVNLENAILAGDEGF